MPVSHTILFRRSSNLKFDYYLNTHMATAEKNFSPSPLISWECFRFPDENAEFVAQITTVWTSMEEFEKVMATEIGTWLLADLPNYSSEPPIVMARERVGGSA